jgi:hypothetical protein
LVAGAYRVNIAIQPVLKREKRTFCSIALMPTEVQALARETTSTFLHTGHRDIELVSKSSSDSGEVDKGPHCQNPEVF